MSWTPEYQAEYDEMRASGKFRNGSPGAGATAPKSHLSPESQSPRAHCAASYLPPSRSRLMR